MLSGIGDPSELASFGITTRVNLPSVGKNMSDHTYLLNAWQTTANQTLETYLAPDTPTVYSAMEQDSPGTTLVDDS